MIWAVPCACAVTSPLVGSTVATVVLSLLHAAVPPPRTAPLAVKVVVALVQSGLVPVTEVTLAFGSTVNNCCCDGVPLQPPVIVKVICAVPSPTAVTSPLVGSTVATAVLSLLQLPVPPPRTTPVA